MAGKNKVFIYGYRPGSRSVTALSQATGFPKIRHTGSRFRGSDAKTVINWGSRRLPEEALRCRVINPPDAVAMASNKLTFFQAVAETPEDRRPMIPPFTVDKQVALGWIQDGRSLFARTELNGHSGQGIQEVNTAEELEAVPDGTLLVQYILKRREFRLHVSANGGVFDVQEKLKRRDLPNEEVNFRVRSYDNGFIFARELSAPVPPSVTENAVRALAVTGLDFGAIDVIYNERRDESYVLEVNTAPGLEGSSVGGYVRMIEGILNV